jgi:heptaprenyl diphosphate synthase
VSLIRVFLIGILFGTGVSLLYSAAGAVLSLSGMVLLKKTGLFSTVTVSVTGGVLHNIGQIAMACFLLETNVIKYYLPFLTLGGVAAGIIIGLVSSVMVQRITLKV